MLFFQEIEFLLARFVGWCWCCRFSILLGCRRILSSEYWVAHTLSLLFYSEKQVDIGACCRTCSDITGTVVRNVKLKKTTIVKSFDGAKHWYLMLLTIGPAIYLEEDMRAQ